MTDKLDDFLVAMELDLFATRLTIARLAAQAAVGEEQYRDALIEAILDVRDSIAELSTKFKERSNAARAKGEGDAQ